MRHILILFPDLKWFPKNRFSIGIDPHQVRTFLHVFFSAAIFILGIVNTSFAETREELTDPGRFPQIDKTFFIEGDQFTFKETPEGTISVWEGNVYAYSKQVSIRTDRLEVGLMEDDRIRTLKASPDVSIQITDENSGSQALITGKVFEYNFETESGRVEDSIIELILGPEAFDLPKDAQYKLYILADSTNIVNGDLDVDQPKILLNSLDNPELTLVCKKVGIITYENKRYLKISNVSVRLFGIKILDFPWDYYRSLTSTIRSGFYVEIPSFGSGDGGMEIDQKFYFTFRDGFFQDKYFTLRADIFTADRWYPEIALSETTGKCNWDILYGYERQRRDFMDESVKVFRNPDFNWRFKDYEPIRNFMVDGGVMYGYLEEQQRRVDSSRLGFHLGVKYDPIPLGNPDTTLLLGGGWRGNYYAGNEDYQVFSGSIGVNHIDKGKYSIGATYYKREEIGYSPFVHDREDVLDEAEFRSRIRLADEWSTGVNVRYDIENEKYRDAQLYIIRLFNSFQVSLGWDFADNNAKLEFGIPGSL